MFLFYLFFFSSILSPTVVDCSLFGGFRRSKTSRRWLSLLRGGADNVDTTPKNILFIMDSSASYLGGYLDDVDDEPDNVLVIPVLSDYMADYYQGKHPNNTELCEVQRMQRWKELLAEKGIQMNTSTIFAVYCDSCDGLADAERLRQQLVSSLKHAKVYHDNPIQSEARRSKYLVHQCVQNNTSLPTLRQRLCHSLDDALEFWEKERKERKAQKIVLKENCGLVSKPAVMCHSRKQVKRVWRDLTSSCEQQNTTIVAQEHIRGTEYAVDVVSRDGQHKVAAIWRRYIRQPDFDGLYYYYQSTLVDASTDENVTAVCDYVKTTLDALGVQYGLSNSIVVVRSDSQQPMLINVSCCPQNMPFVKLTSYCIGYSAFSMLLDAYFGGDEAWDQYPEQPTLEAHGCMVRWVTYVDGWVGQVNHLEDIAELPSFLGWEDFDPRMWARLVNVDPRALQRDFDQIVAWMPDTFSVKKDERKTLIRRAAYISFGMVAHYLATIVFKSSSSFLSGYQWKHPDSALGEIAQQQKQEVFDFND